MSPPAEMTPAEQLAGELQAVQSAGRLRWFHWTSVALAAIATLWVWQLARTHEQLDIREHFEGEAERTAALVEERMDQYADALWSGVSTIESHGGDVDLETWRVYAASRQIHERYPGTNGIGVIREVPRDKLDTFLANERVSRPTFDVHPPHSRDTLYPISYIEPAEPNAAAIGLDMAHETNRLEGILLARDTGTAQITAPITLVQDAGQTAGFLLFAPFYSSDDPMTVDERRATFSGAIYAPFVVADLIDGVLDESQRQVGVRIADQGEVLYDEHVETSANFDPDAPFRTEIPVSIYGRVWTLDIRSSTSFRHAETTQSTTTIFSGMAMTALLLFVFWKTSHANQRTLRLAKDVSTVLRLESEKLEKSNAELANAGRMESIGQLAAGVAHEINTPVQFVSDNTDFLVESFGDLMQSIDHISTVCEQTDADHPAEITAILESLDLDFLREEVPGALAHSKEGLERVAYIVRAMKDFSHPGVEIAPTDLNNVIESTMAISRNEWKYVAELELDLDPDLPMVTCSQGQLKQVILNMVVNAAHAIADVDRSGALGTLYLRTSAHDDHVEIHIGDTGAGISDEIRDRIFDRFFTTKEIGVGTGQGLALAWDVVVTGHKGSIDVDSTLGEGTTFVIRLPIGSDADAIASDVDYPAAA